VVKAAEAYLMEICPFLENGDEGLAGLERGFSSSQKKGDNA